MAATDGTSASRGVSGKYDGTSEKSNERMPAQQTATKTKSPACSAAMCAAEESHETRGGSKKAAAV